jgi:hypothetical protein
MSLEDIGDMEGLMEENQIMEDESEGCSGLEMIMKRRDR